MTSAQKIAVVLFVAFMTFLQPAVTHAQTEAISLVIGESMSVPLSGGANSTYALEALIQIEDGEPGDVVSVIIEGDGDDVLPIPEFDYPDDTLFENELYPFVFRYGNDLIYVTQLPEDLPFEFEIGLYQPLETTTAITFTLETGDLSETLAPTLRPGDTVLFSTRTLRATRILYLLDVEPDTTITLRTRGAPAYEWSGDFSLYDGNGSAQRDILFAPDDEITTAEVNAADLEFQVAGPPPYRLVWWTEVFNLGEVDETAERITLTVLEGESADHPLGDAPTLTAFTADAEETGAATPSAAESTQPEASATPAAECSVRAAQRVNLRGGAGTSFDVVGTLDAGQAAEIDGQLTGSDGIVWWRMVSGEWVRSDVVEETGDCEGVPQVTG